MADTHETIEDVVAWLRRPREGENAYLTLWRDEIADRIEAAHKREIEAIAAKCCQLGRLAGYGASEIKHQQESVGDAAKLREAVGYILKYADCAACRDHDGHTRHYIDQIRKWAQSALAAPARNCDRPECATPKSAQDVWRKEDGGRTAYYEWLLATYKKGDNNGNE